MQNFLTKYNPNKIETSKDEGKLTLDKAKERILQLLTENIRNFKNDTWDISNRMNKLITDTEKNSIFNLRLGGKRIARYSLDLLTTEQKLNFLADFYTGVAKYYENLAKTLTPLIKKTYFEMKENGKDSTLDINIKDYFEFSNSNEKFKENKKTPAENHTKKMPCKPEVLLAWCQAHILGD